MYSYVFALFGWAKVGDRARVQGLRGNFHSPAILSTEGIKSFRFGLSCLEALATRHAKQIPKPSAIVADYAIREGAE